MNVFYVLPRKVHRMRGSKMTQCFAFARFELFNLLRKYQNYLDF